MTLSKANRDLQIGDKKVTLNHLVCCCSFKNLCDCSCAIEPKTRDSGFQTKGVFSHTSWRKGRVLWSFGNYITENSQLWHHWNFQAGDKLKAMKSLLNSNDTVPKTVGNVFQPPTNGAEFGLMSGASTICRCESAFLVPELNGLILSCVTPTNGTVMCNGFIKFLSLHSREVFQFVHRKPVIHQLSALQVEFFFVHSGYPFIIRPFLYRSPHNNPICRNDRLGEKCLLWHPSSPESKTPGEDHLLRWHGAATWDLHLGRELFASWTTYWGLGNVSIFGFFFEPILKKNEWLQ